MIPRAGERYGLVTRPPEPFSWVTSELAAEYNRTAGGLAARAPRPDATESGRMSAAARDLYQMRFDVKHSIAALR